MFHEYLDIFHCESPSSPHFLRLPRHVGGCGAPAVRLVKPLLVLAALQTSWEVLPLSLGGWVWDLFKCYPLVIYSESPFIVNFLAIR